MSIASPQERRIRLNLAKYKDLVSITDLLAVQIKSYNKFMQMNQSRAESKKTGLHRALSSIFPIESPNGAIELNYKGYRLDEPKFGVDDCRLRGCTYAAKLYITLQLSIYAKEEIKTKKTIVEVKEQEVFVCDMPLMLENGSFLINGSGRVVVSQLHRAPGVFFSHDQGKVHSSGMLLYSARVIPYRGSWLDLEFDHKGYLYTKIDRKKKFSVIWLLKALLCSNQDILRLFYSELTISCKDNGFFMHVNADQLVGKTAFFDLKDEKGDVIVVSGNQITKNHSLQLNIGDGFYVSKDGLEGLVITDPIVDSTTGEVIVDANDVIDLDAIEKMIHAKVSKFSVVDAFSSGGRLNMSDMLRVDQNHSSEDALIMIYTIMRPGEPPSIEVATEYFEKLFFDPSRYDLSDVGRMKINLRFGRQALEGPNYLEKADVLEILKELTSMNDRKLPVDDIDSLSNRRLRQVGELIENQVRTGLLRVVRSTRERMGSMEIESMSPRDVFNSKPIMVEVKDFFATGQLSQFMDEVNPLSSLAHTRRITALGAGGLNRDRAGFEVRDVHPTHYGRLCPIETPEGPNIGLISSLSIYAKVNDYGFISTPYRVVNSRCITDEIKYVSAIEEPDYFIAQSRLEVKDNMILDEVVPCRHQREFTTLEADKINYMDVSARQIVSLASSLIPFLEHDDANRALMGSNMQRQAIPLLRAEKPLVGTGMESVGAVNSGLVVCAKRSGKVIKCDANRVVIHADSVKENEPLVDVYKLVKCLRSNNNTMISKKPLVSLGSFVKAGDVIADGPSTDLGELSLGKNLLVAFMPWRGYNFEDSIILSEALLKKDTLTSAHIIESVCTSRETKIGSEEITADVPNASPASLSKLDAEGIVCVGAKVRTGDVLVGKVTPREEVTLTPDVRLLHAIFGDKASDVKDSSLRVPEGIEATVIDVKILARDDERHGERLQKISQDTLRSIEEDLQENLDASVAALEAEIRQILLSKKTLQGKVLTRKDLDVALKDLFKIDLTEDDELLVKPYKSQHTVLKSNHTKALKDQKKLYYESHDLPVGVIKVVKVYLAVKRRIQVGDKLAGRHGNKGVISTIVPEEDMPYLEDGTRVDVILNPLGVPSRMNIGQILETHLGWAAKGLGNQIKSRLNQPSIDYADLRKYLSEIYQNAKVNKADIQSLSNDELHCLAEHLADGVPMASPVFDGASEDKIKSLLKLAGLPENGKAKLTDGLTGLPFEREITVGYMYVLKLNHMVDEKMHARSTGSYSLVTQQPLGGKAQFGGQRFGEMEVWALQAYGAAHTLQELTTIKSDDVIGRSAAYKSIVDGKNISTLRTPEAFRVLQREIQAIGIDFDLSEVDIQ
jgi:DNA-directed RNA polymerase subunit beta